ncbi:MAG: 3'-5' exonuclease [Desulfofustis sp.]|nr:3'-5' exonuclease [Desulfofustis sp.]MBT8354144.1 3'-5' exonuclease [Desulfofustis sp.]NNF47833.1 3'-5' exonuclease [Desulfofustis sp.]
MALRPNAHILPVDWATIISALSETARTLFFKKFYESCLTDPQASLGGLCYVALDFETTGLDLANDSIVSIGLVPFDLQRIYCRNARYWLVKQDGQLPESSVLVHGITHGQLDSAGDLGTIIKLMLGSLGNRMVVAHYHHIERQFLQEGARRCYDEAIQFPIIDTMLIEKAVTKRRGKTLLRLFDKPEKPSLRLPDCRRYYGLPVYRQHHALTDAIATAELFQAQVAHHFSKQTPISDLWV